MSIRADDRRVAVERDTLAEVVEGRSVGGQQLGLLRPHAGGAGEHVGRARERADVVII